MCSGNLFGDLDRGIFYHVRDHDGRAFGGEAMGHVPP